MIARIKCLGSMGRLGNQMFQYAFAKAWCDHHGYTLQTPKDWIGRRIWRAAYFDDCIHEDDGETYQQLGYDEIPESTEYNYDFQGNYEKADHLSFYTRDYVKSLFKLNYHLAPYFEHPACEDYIAVHVRRGDYFLVNEQVINKTRNPEDGYSIISYRSYKNLIDKVGGGLKVRWVMEPGISFEEKRWVGFNQYNDFMSVLDDFYCLVKSKILIRSNSTFSVWAGFLHRGEKIYSPKVGLAGMMDCEFSEGNSERIRLSGDDFLLNVS